MYITYGDFPKLGASKIISLRFSPGPRRFRRFAPGRPRPPAAAAAAARRRRASRRGALGPPWGRPEGRGARPGAHLGVSWLQ